MSASTAASRSPRAIAEFSAAAKAAKRRRALGEQAATGRREQQRAHQASGRVRATSTATPAPNEDPTRWHDVTPRWSRVSSTSATGSSGPCRWRSDSPKPRRSSRTAYRKAVSPPHWGSHIRRSATPGVQQHHRGAAARAGAVDGDAGGVSDEGTGLPRVWWWVTGQSTRRPGPGANPYRAGPLAMHGARSVAPLCITSGADPLPLDLTVDPPVGRGQARAPRRPAARRRGRGARGRRPG